MKSLHSDLLFKCLILYVTMLFVLAIFIFLTFNLSEAQSAGAPMKMVWDNYIQGSVIADAILVQRCRGISCTNYATIKSLSITETKFTDPNVYHSTSYRWQLRASSNGTHSVPSNNIAAFIPMLPLQPMHLMFDFGVP